MSLAYSTLFLVLAMVALAIADWHSTVKAMQDDFGAYNEACERNPIIRKMMFRWGVGKTMAGTTVARLGLLLGVAFTAGKWTDAILLAMVIMGLTVIIVNYRGKRYGS